VDRLAAILATLVVGALVAFQPPVNSQLGHRTSVLGAAFVSTAVAAVVMAAVFLVVDGPQPLAGLRGVPLVYLTGGLMGAALVSVSLVTVRTLGAGGVVAATVCTQLIVSAALDRLGVLGLAGTPISAAKLAGFALLIAGTLLVTVVR
jgi:transporter family-2 protein